MRRRSAIRLTPGNRLLKALPLSRLGLAIGLALSLGVVAAATGFAANRAPQSQAKAEHLGTYVWRAKPEWFGGFSALELDPNGRDMIVLSDRSTLVRARLQRQNNSQGGNITGVEMLSAKHLRSSKGRRLFGRIMDSEGLAVAADGSLFISFEGVARVVHHRDETTRARVLPRARAFRAMPLNKSLEALAINAKGHLYTLPENAPDEDGNIPVWRWDGQAWSQPYSLPRRGGFLPVGADFGPDGRFYLLERDFTLIGFHSRLRRWDVTAQGLGNEVTLLRTGTGTHDNLEGLSVWRDASGDLRATMVSDDNFMTLQRTELVEYRLPE